MKKHTTNNNFTIAPETLEDHPFYGLKLDPEQKIFRDAIWDKDNIVTICEARSGSGKSTVALGVANLLVQYGRYEEIVYIAFPTQEQRQGFIPGDPEDKNAPYMEPLYQALLTLNINPDTAIKSSTNIQGMKNGTAYITFTSDTYLRGTNFENKVIIVDEFQNSYFDISKKVLTRIHDSCKVIICGQMAQCDLLKHQERSGFKVYIDAFEKIKDDPRVSICKLNTNHRGWFSSFCDDVDFKL